MAKTGRPSRYSQSDKKEMMKMYEDKKTITSIGESFGCSKWTVLNILRHQNYEPRYACEVCGKKLIGNRQLKWCSKHCQYTSKRKHKNCKICNIPLVRKDDNINVKYCDKCSCSHKSQTFSDIRTKRKQILINMKGGKCIHCGYNKCFNALEFHHREKATKLFNLAGSGISSRKWVDVVAEADKCDLVCSNCHREKEETYFESLRKPIGKRARDLQ